MSAGLFREQMKSCFGIRLEPRELGFCVATYGNKDTQQINSIDFLTKFLIMGKQSRYEKHRKFLVKQRQAIKEAKKEAEDKLTAQFEKAELNVDLNDWRDTLAAASLAANGFAQVTHPAGKFRSFPAWLAVGALDKAFVRGAIEVRQARIVKTSLSKIASDHLPLVIDFHVG
jgi:endonuclease/exonuclease/phosphatase family metal-dependent hydrolase